jgi:hypothetical protein
VHYSYVQISAAAANRRRLLAPQPQPHPQRRLAGVEFTLTVRTAPAAAPAVAAAAQSIGASSGRAASLAAFITQDLVDSGVGPAGGGAVGLAALPAAVVAEAQAAPAYVAPPPATAASAANACAACGLPRPGGGSCACASFRTSGCRLSIWWKLRADGAVVDFKVSSPQSAWFSVGLNPARQMAGAYAVIVAPAEAAAADRVREFTIGGSYDINSLAVQASQDLTDVGVTQVDGVTAATFSRAVDTPDASDIAFNLGGTDGMVEACGSSNAIAYHSARGDWVHDWTAAAPAPAAPTPPPTPAPTPAPTPPGRCGTMTRTIVIPQCDMTVVASFSGAGAAASVTFDITMARRAWLALGLNAAGTMAGSYAVVVKPGEAVGAASVREYNIGGGYSTASVAAQTSQDLTAASVTQSGGSTTASFTRLLRTADAEDAAVGCAAAQTLVFACGAGNGFGQHALADRGAVSYDWVAGVGSAAGQGGMTASVIALHAALMLLAWALLIPCGVAVAALFKDFKKDAWWFRVHRAGSVAGLICATVGFAVIAGATSDANRAHFGGGHQRLGLAVMLLGWLQPLNAALRPPAPKAGDKAGGAKQPRRRVWELVHKGSGRLALCLGFAACASGLGQVGPNGLGLEVVHGGLTAFFVAALAAVVLLVGYGCAKRGKARSGVAGGGGENEKGGAGRGAGGGARGAVQAGAVDGSPRERRNGPGEDSEMGRGLGIRVAPAAGAGPMVRC